MPFIILSFVAIAAMRVVQTVCGKKVSNSVSSGEMFFRYGTLYNVVAAFFSLITLAITGFYGFNLPTFLCAFISAVLFALELFTSIEALKGCSITVATMFGLGGLIISCILSIFLFDEPMSVFQAIGLSLFFIGVYLLTPNKMELSKKINFKTYVLLFINLLVNGLTMVVQKYFGLLCEGKLIFTDCEASSYNVATNSFLTFLLNALLMLVCAIVLYRKSKTQEQKILEGVKSDEKLKKHILFGLTKTHLICGSSLALAVFVINYLVTELGKTVPSVILFPVSSAISIGLSAIIGWLLYKEKLTTRNLIGLLIGLVGIVLIGVLTPTTVSDWF